MTEELPTPKVPTRAEIEKGAFFKLVGDKWVEVDTPDGHPPGTILASGYGRDSSNLTMWMVGTFSALLDPNPK